MTERFDTAAIAEKPLEPAPRGRRLHRRQAGALCDSLATAAPDEPHAVKGERHVRVQGDRDHRD